MNTIQTEAQLEENLIKQLQNLEYECVTIKDENDLIQSIKTKSVKFFSSIKINLPTLKDRKKFQIFYLELMKKLKK